MPADLIEDHDRGLAHDLGVMESMMARRRALKLFAGIGGAGLLTACGGSSGGGTTTTTGTATPTPTPTPSATATPTPTPTPTSTSSTCVALPTETNGPYPADGTNTSRGSTSNVLTSSGVVRSDIRSSFLGSTTAAAGVPVTLTLTLTVVDVNSACAVLPNYAVYIWHCDATGNYSLYDVPAESWLRGVQVTNSAGQVTFTTIFPGCYAGRFPHMHFEVFSSLATATGGRFASLVSQLAMPSAACSAVYSGASATYGSSAARFASTTTSNDNVFGDNSAAQVTAMTPTFSGSVAAGYTMSAVIGLAR